MDSSPSPHHRGLTIPQRTPNRWSSQFPTLFPCVCRLWESPADVSFGSAICSDVTNASTAETFSVSFTLLSSIAFAWFVTRFSEDFLANLELQAVQFSIFTFHRFVTAGMMVALFVTQISHNHWSQTAGTTADDCHDVSFHLHMFREQMLLSCPFFFKVCGAHGQKNGESHVLKETGLQCVLGSVVQDFAQAWMVCARSSILAASAECCRPDSSRLLMGHTEQPIFAFVTNMVLSCCPRDQDVAVLDPSHLSH